MARYLIASLALMVGAVACSEEIPELRQTDVEAAVDNATGDLLLAELACLGIDELEPISEGEFVLIVCTGVLSGDEITLDVALTRTDAESVDATVTLETPILDVSIIEAAAAARLDLDLSGSPTVSCAEPRVVISVGREISCRVTSDGGTAGPVDRPAVVRILDADGAWELDLTP